jgi:uncharacterized protein
MSMASSPQHEPTMEEILASIRKITAEDTTETPPAPPAAAAAPVEADVLDLTQEVHDEPAPAVIAAAPPPPAPEFQDLRNVEPESEPMPEPVKSEPSKIENDVVFQTIEETEVSEAPAMTHATSHEGIFSDKTRKALEDSFATIPAAKAEVAPPAAAAVAAEPSAPAGDGSVQAVFEKAVRESFEPVLHTWLGENSEHVVEKLKPLVRQWMDDHFPALLEGAVRAEVERVARARH